MAVFMLNVCKFNGCGLTFKNLGHLIRHIEETHIDYDPHVVEQTEQNQPACIPLSYVLSFLTDAARKENAAKAHQQGNNKQIRSSSNNESTSQKTAWTGSEAEEGEDFCSEPDDSSDSWTTSEDFSNDVIVRCSNNRITSQSTVNNSHSSSDKPFACPVPGCKKRYKNVNGIKYHRKNGHKNDTNSSSRTLKTFTCLCGKSYKTLYGLKNHEAAQHNGTQQMKPPRSNKSRVDQDSSSSSSNSNTAKELTEEAFNATPSAVIRAPRIKISAMEDHVYIKQEHYMESEPCDNNLGVLTPASSPPMPPASSPVQKQQHSITSNSSISY